MSRSILRGYVLSLRLHTASPETQPTPFSTHHSSINCPAWVRSRTNGVKVRHASQLHHGANEPLIHGKCGSRAQMRTRIPAIFFRTVVRGLGIHPDDPPHDPTSIAATASTWSPVFTNALFMRKNVALERRVMVRNAASWSATLSGYSSTTWRRHSTS